MTEKKGLVLYAVSGSSFVIKFYDQEKPFEVVSLLHSKSPKLGLKEREDKDEEDAFLSFDRARMFFVGKTVKVYPEKNSGDKTINLYRFGQIPIYDARIVLEDGNIDIAEYMMKEGWVKIRKAKDSETSDPYYKKLESLCMDAESNELGLFAEYGFVRPVNVKINPSTLVKTRFEGYVQLVSSGSRVTIYHLNQFCPLKFQVAGIRTRSSKGDEKDGIEIESRTFVEDRLLHRTVEVHVLDYRVDKNENLFVGTMRHRVNGDIVPMMLENGLAKIDSNTIDLCTDATVYRMSELEAKKAKAGFWANSDFDIVDSGVVKGEIVGVKGNGSVDVLVNGETKRLYLTNVKVPQFMPPNHIEHLGLQARELLRSFVGKECYYEVDYSHNGQNERRDYATVFVGKQCLNVELVSKAFCSVVNYKDSVESKQYAEMTKLDEKNKHDKKGIYNKEKNEQPFNNYSANHPIRVMENVKNYYLNKTLKGVVEYVHTATRLSILIPENNAMIRVNLHHVKQSKPETRAGKEALEYVQNKYMYKDVEVYCVELDKSGLFNVDIFCVDKRLKQNIVEDLIQKGHVDLYEPSLRNAKENAKYTKARDQAKKDHLGIWKYKSPDDLVLSKGKAYECRIFSAKDPTNFSVNIKNDSINLINKRLADAKDIHPDPMIGDFVACVCDKGIYRAEIDDIQGDEVLVYLVDTGEQMRVRRTDIRKLPESIYRTPAQSITVALGCCQLTRSEGPTKEALDLFWELVGDKDVYIHLMRHGDSKNKELQDVLVTYGESINSTSVNAELLRKGYVGLFEPQIFEEMESAFETLISAENEAEKNGV